MRVFVGAEATFGADVTGVDAGGVEGWSLDRAQAGSP
jgi:hypothetical protein